MLSGSPFWKVIAMHKTVARLFVGGSLLLPSVASLAFFAAAIHAADAPAPAGGAITVRSIRGKCGMCHREIAQEWLTSMHSKAFRDVNFVGEAAHEKDAEGKCFICHSPQAVRAKGLGQTPTFRVDMREVGVDCVVCHTNPAGKVHAPFRSGSSPHDVTVDVQHATEVLCASCHSEFGTLAEFKQTTFAKQGQTCQTCHMPKVKRPVATGGQPKLVAQHIWRGGDDPDMLKKAVKFENSVKPDGTVVATIANVGAGHKFPTGIRFHSAILDVSVTDASGKAVFSKQEVFADQTKTGGTDTRINPGETRTVTVATGQTAGTFTARMLYKSMPNMEDKDATVFATATAKL
jgi:Cytochrome c554 and c-prime